jgi:phenylpyruvate tautomerase
MPLLRLETTISLPEEKRAELMKSFSKLVAETLGKPEQYVMVTVSPSAILMSGQPGDAAFIDLRSIGGLSSETNRKLTERLCEALQRSLNIAPERVYVTLTEVRASHWGWNGATFG